MILESLQAALAFLARAWSRPWFWASIAAVGVAGASASAMANPSIWLSPAIIVGTLFFLPLVQGPLYSLAVDEAPPETTLAGGGARYVRLVVVGLLTDIFLAVPGLLIFVVGLGAAYGMAYSHPGFDRTDISTWTASGPVLVGSTAVLSVGGLAMLWLSARIALGAAATVAERRVLMISTWPLTRGKGWRVAIARLLASLAAVLVVIAVSLVVRAAVPGAAARLIPVVSGMLLLGLRAPLKVGVLSYFYRHRSPLPVS